MRPIPFLPLALLLGCAAPAIDSTEATALAALSFACAPGDPVLVTGPGGAPLVAGDVVSGADVRAIVLDNNVARITYELLDQYGALPPVRELGGHMLWRRTGDGQPFARAFSPAYGDWTYFVAPFRESAYEAHVLTASDDVAEVAFIFAHDLDYPGAQDSYGFTPAWWQGPDECTPANGCGCFLAGCGVLEHDSAAVGVRLPPYCGGPECFRRIRSVRLAKTIRLERCAEGYFVGLHSDPPLDPKNGLAGNNSASTGEREMGTGGWNAVTWSSAGNVFHHPGQAQHGYMGIDDPTYLGAYPGQYPSFPAEQATGPWWVADLPYHNRDGEIPFVRYVALEHRLESGVWAFSLNQLGSTVVHFVNAETEVDGRPTRYQLFLGAMPYVSDETPCTIAGLSGTWRCYPSEPKPSTTTAIVARIPTDWPQ